MKAAIYTRVSTEDQIHNYSIPTQVEACEKAARELGYEVLPEHIFIDDGYSGAILDRPNLEKLRTVTEQGEIQGIICYDTDRLSRKLAHLLLLTEEWDRRNIATHFVLAPMDSSPEGKMFLQIRGIFAEYERAKFMERSARGRKKRIQEGKVQVSRRPTYGYEYHSKNSNNDASLDGKYTINEFQAEVVKHIFQWFLEEDLSTREIAQRLVKEGIPSPTGLGRWHRFTVAQILKNYTYAGIMYHNKRTFEKSQKEGKKHAIKIKPKEEWIGVPVPGIVSEKWIDLAVAKLEQHKRRSKRKTEHQYLLSGMGILRCKCGSAMTGHARLRKSGKCYRWYDCNNQYPGYWPRQHCQVRDLNAELADKAVWQKITELLLNPDLIIHELHRRYKTKEEELSRLHKELDFLEQKLGKIDKERRDLAFMGRQAIFGPNTFQIIATEAKKLEIEEKSLLQERTEIEQRLKMYELREEDVACVDEFCRRVRENLDDFTFEEKRQAIATLAHKIVWDGETLHLHLIVPSEEVPILSISPSP